MNIKSVIGCCIPDKLFLSIKYYKKFGKTINWKNPSTYNEKLQYLKLHDHNPIYTVMVDKYCVKQYVTRKIGEEYIIPTLGVWDSFDDIDFDSLPNSFVLKCTHDSGGIVIVADKKVFNKENARRKLEDSLKRNYYYVGREWPYKKVKRKIIAEKYMTDESGVELKDYKVFCFGGVPKIIQVDFGRFTEHKRNLYTTDWKLIDAMIGYPSNPEINIPKPKKLDLMLELAGKLSKDLIHARVDFYSVDEKLYFGEITLYHGSGLEKFSPDSFEKEFSSWLSLDNHM